MEKKVLVIGGGSGIGKQIIEDLLEEGYEPIAASRSIDADTLPRGINYQKFDVTSDDILDLPESLAGLVYCPGSINLKPFKRFGLEEIRQEFEVNYFGAVKVLQQSIEALKRGQGSAVFFSTVAAHAGMNFHTAIASAKGALEGLILSMAAEYAPDVRFNVIAPSLTDTPLAAGLLNNDRKREANAQRHPLKKIGTPKDISNLAMYLLTHRSQWVTGQVFKIDGGMSSLRPL